MEPSTGRPIIRSSAAIEAKVGRSVASTRAMGIASTGDGDELAVEKLIVGLRRLNADLSVPGPRAYGIEREHWFDSLPLMAEQALASGSPANNPRIPEAAEIVDLYQRVWDTARV